MCRSRTGALQLLWASCQAMALVLDGASGEQRVLSLGSTLVSGKCSLDGELMAAPPKRCVVGSGGSRNCCLAGCSFGCPSRAKEMPRVALNPGCKDFYPELSHRKELQE